MQYSETDKTLALAGIFQAAHLANQIAFNQEINENTFKISMESIFKIESADVASVFGDKNGVRTGLSYVIQYGTKEPPFKEKILIRYLFYIANLGKKVINNPELSKHLQRRLQPIISQATHLGTTNEIVIKELALLYRQVFLGRHLQVPVLGKLDVLKKTDVVHKIYAALMAGIRSAVLWYQVGGNRWQLFFGRKHLREQADFLLRHESSSLYSN
jgi:high frequency lysogenization protein